MPKKENEAAKVNEGDVLNSEPVNPASQTEKPLDNPPSGAVTESDQERLEKEREAASEFEAATGANVLEGDDPARVALEAQTSGEAAVTDEQTSAAEKKAARLNEPGRPASPPSGAVESAKAAKERQEVIKEKAAKVETKRIDFGSRPANFVVPSTPKSKMEAARKSMAGNPSHDSTVRGEPLIPQPLNRKAAAAMGIGNGGNTHRTNVESVNEPGTGKNDGGKE